MWYRTCVLKRRLISNLVARQWMSSDVRVRFAPSPTGQLHLGGYRTALYNYLFAKQHGGKFILRIEDTDRTRLVPGAEDKLEELLNWIGIPPDESPTRGGEYGPYRQSERLEHYHAEVDRMLADGTAYRCFCTPKRLDLLRKEAARNKTENRYDGRCRNLSEQEIQDKLGQGLPYTVRFRMPPERQSVPDTVLGKIEHDIYIECSSREWSYAPNLEEPRLRKKLLHFRKRWIKAL